MGLFDNRTYRGLLFLEGHVADAPLALSLAGAEPALPGPRRPVFDLFRGFGLLGGLRATDARAAGDEPFAARYGNRRASVRVFGDAPAPAEANPGDVPAHEDVRRGHGWAATEVSIALSSFR